MFSKSLNATNLLFSVGFSLYAAKELSYASPCFLYILDKLSTFVFITACSLAAIASKSNLVSLSKSVVNFKDFFEA